MNLREKAESDLARILESATGFGWPITITDPAGVSAPLIGYSNDISQVIDPDTGIAVSGRSASVTLRISSIYAAALSLPKGIADSGSKPWVIQFNDINGLPYTFKVAQSNPDRGLGIVTCILETYVA